MSKKVEDIIKVDVGQWGDVRDYIADTFPFATVVIKYDITRKTNYLIVSIGAWAKEYPVSRKIVDDAGGEVVWMMLAKSNLITLFTREGLWPDGEKTPE